MMAKKSFKKMLKNHLEQVNELQGFKKESLYSLVLERGRWFKPSPLPRTIKRGEIGLCYNNSFSEIMRCKKEITYVEGFAYAKGLEGIPMMHAWLTIPGSGLAFDPTWENGSTYFGIEWPFELVVRSALKIRYAGILPNLISLIKHDDCNPFKPEAWESKIDD